MTKYRRALDGLVAEARKWLRDWDDARPVVGVIEIIPGRGGSPGQYNLNIKAEDFGPVHWVALADASLDWAAQKLAAMPGDNRENLMMIERARTALDFGEFTKQ